MPLNDIFPKGVALLVRPVLSGGFEPFATSFIMQWGTEIQSHYYLVTAAHVVMMQPDTHVRLRHANGTLEDRHVPRWTYHSSDDVAVAPIILDGLEHAAIPAKHAIDSQRRFKLTLGIRVYFIGLLRHMEAMGVANVPIVRSGIIGRLNQEKIKLGDPNGVYMNGHLVDCRAYKGMSGSPCFAQFDIPSIEIEDGRPSIFMKYITFFIGLFSAHFDDSDRGTPIHTGVGAVTPSRAILEVLMFDDKLKAEREESDRNRPSTDLTATLDAMQPSDELSEVERFEALMGGLLAVPKDEANEVHRGHQE